MNTLVPQGIITGLLFFNLLMTIRTARVNVFRSKILLKMFDVSMNDIRSGKDPDWRWKSFEKASHRRMVLTFWKKLEMKNYWNDELFLKTTPTDYSKSKVSPYFNKI